MEEGWHFGKISCESEGGRVLDGRGQVVEVQLDTGGSEAGSVTTPKRLQWWWWCQARAALEIGRQNDAVVASAATEAAAEEAAGAGEEVVLGVWPDAVWARPGFALHWTRGF